MKFISICSGIEAASVAFNTIGWEAIAFSEIEPFPCALLAHHYPDIPNFGDMTNFREWPEEVFAQADMIVGGPPCQSFSVAGKRQGLNDDRGNLTLIYTELIEHADTIRLKHGKPPVIVIYENVPGLLSDKTGAFGCFIAALAGGSSEARSPGGGRWANAGYVLGPERTVAWRVLDAQHFGLAQRRKRVFLVASARDGLCPAEILFEFDGVRRDIAPSREAGKEIAGDVGTGANQTGFRKLTFESYAQDETASTMMARDYKSYTDLVAYSFDSLSSNSMKSSNPHSGCREVNLSKTLDTTIPCPSKNQGGIGIVREAYGIPGNWIGRKPENGGNSTQFMHEISPAQTATDKHGVICIGGQHPNAAIGEEVAPTLTEAMGAGGGHIPIVNDVIAFNSRQDPVSGDVFGALDTSSPQAQAIAIQGTVIGRKPENGPQGQGYDESGVCFTQTAADRHAVATNSSVRRLTPIECERLMGFPDFYTAIPWRNKPAEDCPDGHRYKALGNSMAVPVMRWIGERINAHL